jgi:excisionase family DNA binding protein
MDTHPSGVGTDLHADSMEPLIDRRQGARILGISVRHLEYLITRGQLPAVRIGRRVLLLPEDVRAFIRAHRGGQS